MLNAEWKRDCLPFSIQHSAFIISARRCSMRNGPPPRSRRWVGPLSLTAAGLFSLIIGLGGCGRPAGETPSDDPPPADGPPVGTESGSRTFAPSPDLVQQVHAFCGACHAYPPPDTFPRDAWKMEVERGYLFFADSLRPLRRPPPFEATVKYYEERAPK